MRVLMRRVSRFIRAAVEDPDTLAIKMTVYRTSDDTPFVPLLIQAAESGKQAACLVELKRGSTNIAIFVGPTRWKTPGCT